MFKIGLIGLDQICFTGDKRAEYERAKKELSGLQQKLGFTLAAYENTIITRAQAEEAVVFFKNARVDFLLIQNASFAAGETILPLAKMGLPLGLWSIPEPAAKGVLPLNSFCGVNMYASIVTNYLKEHRIKYKYFHGYASSARFIERLSVTVKALDSIKQLRGAKVALIGGIAPGFNDLYFDERVIEKKLGVNIQRNHEYGEIRDRAVSYSQEEIAPYITECLSGYSSTCEGAEHNIITNARFLKAYEDFAAENKYDALAISCWPKIQAEFMTCACHSVAKLNQLGIPAACEGDIPGALGMLLLKYLSGGQPVTLLDLVAFDELDDTVQLWHCGPTALPFANRDGAGLDFLPENTDAKGKNKRYLRYVHDMTIKGGDATIAMFCNDFDKMFILDGKFIDHAKDRFAGSAGWLGGMSLNRKGIGATDLINTILTLGVQHHYPVVMGNYSKELMEVRAWLGIGAIEALAYEDYLQI